VRFRLLLCVNLFASTACAEWAQAHEWDYFLPPCMRIVRDPKLECDTGPISQLEEAQARLIGRIGKWNVYEISYFLADFLATDSSYRTKFTSVVAEIAPDQFSEIAGFPIYSPQSTAPTTIVALGNVQVLQFVFYSGGSPSVAEYSFMAVAPTGPIPLNFTGIDPVARKWVGPDLWVYPVNANYDLKAMTWTSCVQKLHGLGSRRFAPCAGTVKVSFQMRGRRAVPIKINYKEE
jgi:hypothetical protein